MKDDRVVDRKARRLHEEAFSIIDCTQCANCCKTIHPLLTEADIERLRLLATLVASGYAIGQIAGLPTEELVEMAAVEKALVINGVPGPSSRQTFDSITHSALVRSEQAVQGLDGESLKSILTHSSLTLDHVSFIDELLAPLIGRVGELWGSSEIGIAHEHLASAVLLQVMGRVVRSGEPVGSAPGLVVSTPAGERHEFGALFAAATASSEGWRVTYLGPNLPADDIATAVRTTGADALAMSIVVAAEEPDVAQELRELRLKLPPTVPILLGGAASSSYQSVIDEIEAIHLADMVQLRSTLASLA